MKNLCGSIGPFGWKCKLEAGHIGNHCASQIETLILGYDERKRTALQGAPVYKVITGAPRK